MSSFNRGKDQTTHRCLGIISVCIWFLVLQGSIAVEELDTFLARATATVLSTALSTGIYVFWWQLYQVLPGLRTAGARVRTLVFIFLAALPLLIGASATLAVAGIVGDGARSKANDVAITELSSVSTARYEAVKQLSGALVDLKLLSEKFTSDHDAERKSGAISGTGGAGAVQAALGSISLLLTGLKETIEKALTEGEATYDAAQKDTEAMREIASKDLPNTEKTKQLKAVAERLRKKLSDINHEDTSNALVRAAVSLLSQIDGLSFKLSTDPAVAKNQRDALARLRAQVAGAAEQLQALGEKLAAIEVPDVPEFRQMSPTQVVIRYAGEYSTAWCAALLIDTAPLWPILILVLAASDRTREDEIANEIATLTVHELMLHKSVEAMLKAPPLDADVRALIAKQLGREARK